MLICTDICFVKPVFGDFELNITISQYAGEKEVSRKCAFEVKLFVNQRTCELINKK